MLNFLPKKYFFTNKSNLTKIEFFNQNLFFYEEFDFLPKLYFLQEVKHLIFGQNFDF